MNGRWPFLLLALASGAASADPYDFQLAKLGNPQPGGFGYSPSADANFRVFARQIGAALTSANLAPPATLGHSGFSLTAELSMVDFAIPAAGDYKLPTTEAFQGWLKIPSLHLRKGLPASFEVGARAAWIEQSRMGAATLELKWAVNEGFTYLPDIAVRGNITKLMNGRNVDVTTGGFDLGLGKQFELGGMVTITPYAGVNFLFVGATSSSIDFNPTRSLATSDLAAEQFTNYFVFSPVSAGDNFFPRFYGGFRFIAGVMQLGAELSYAALGSFTVNKATGEKRDTPSVLALNFHVGLDF